MWGRVTLDGPRKNGAGTNLSGTRCDMTTRVVGAILTTYFTRKLLWLGWGMGVVVAAILIWMPDTPGMLLPLWGVAWLFAMQLHEHLVCAQTAQLPGGRPWHLAVGSVLFILGIFIGPLVVGAQMGWSVRGLASLLVGFIGVSLLGQFTYRSLLLVSLAVYCSAWFSPAVQAWLSALTRGDALLASLLLTATGACALVILGVRLRWMHEESPEWTAFLESGWGLRRQEAHARQERPTPWAAAVTRWTQRRLDSGVILSANTSPSAASLWRRAHLWRLGAGPRQPWINGLCVVGLAILQVGTTERAFGPEEASQLGLASWALPFFIGTAWQQRWRWLGWESLRPVPRRRLLRELGAGALLDMAEGWCAFLLGLGVFVGVWYAPQVRWAWVASFVVGSLWLQMFGFGFGLWLLSWGRGGLSWGGMMLSLMVILPLDMPQALERALGLTGGTVLMAGVSVVLTWLAYRRWCGVALDVRR